MSLDNLQGEDDIIAELRTIDGIDVMNGEYTEDSYVPVVDANKMFKPYVLVKFNGAFPAYNNGIAGPELDMQRSTFSVYVVTPDDRITRSIRNQVRIKMLTNFTPTDGSSLRAISGLSFVDSDLGYNRYVHVVAFSYYFNLS